MFQGRRNIISEYFLIDKEIEHSAQKWLESIKKAMQ